MINLKFYLNKILKCDNIENYSLRSLEELRKCYDEFVKSAGGDPDFPSIPMGNDENNIRANNLLVGEEVEDLGNNKQP